MPIDLQIPRPKIWAGLPGTHVRLDRELPGLPDAKVAECLKAIGRNLPAQRARMALAAAVAQEAYNATLRQRGQFGQAYRLLAEAGPVKASDIDAFTTQQLLFITDVFERFDLLDVLTVMQATGPTVRVNTRTFTRADDSEYYDVGDALSEGNDPSYTECPTDCEEANRIGVEVDGEVVEMECRRIASEYCTPAQFHWDAQYPGTLEGVLDEGMSIELKRGLQSEALTRMVANAGGTTTWNQTPEADSYFETAHPREWKNELWTTIKGQDREIRKAQDGKVPADKVLGHIDATGILEDAIGMELAPGIAENGRAQADEFTNFAGRTKQGRYAVYEFLTFPEDTLLVMAGGSAVDPTYVLAVWLMMSDLGRLQDPLTGKVSKGMLHLSAQHCARPGRIREIQIGA